MIIMQKIVKKYGDSLVITFNREEQNIFDIAEGDIFTIPDDSIIIKKEGKTSGKHKTKV